MKSQFYRLLLLCVFSTLCSITNGQLTTLGSWNAYVYNPNVSAPVILAFHGQGQMGTNPSSLLTDGFPKLITQGFVPPKAAFIITPQGQWGGWDGQYTRLLLQKIKQQYPLADTNRVYLTGFSAGGKSAFEGVYILPKALITFATAGATDPQIAIITSNRIKSYLYIGQNDGQFSGITTSAASKINQAVPNLARLTVIPNTGHGGWNEKYVTNEFWDLIEATTTPPIDITPDSIPNPGIIVPPSGAVQIVQVAAGEYYTAFRTNTGRLFSTKWSNNSAVPYDAGISKVMDVFGAQYTVAVLDSAGKAYIVGATAGTPYVNAVTTDNLGNAFTGNTKIYGLYKNYLTIRAGNVWYWGEGDYLNQNGGANITAPIKLISPAGKTMRKLVATSPTSVGRLTVLWGLATDGTLWQWDRSNTTPFQVTFPTNIAEDITMVDEKAFVIKTATDLFTWGYYPAYAGGELPWVNSNIHSVKAKWQAAGCVFPIREMAGNANSLHIIDANYNMFASGSMSQGEVGNGQELSPWRTAPTPWNWDWSNGTNLVAPTQIPGKFQKICKGNTIAFYVYAQDMGGDWYSWGRNKSFSLGNGATLAAYGGQGYDQFPNALNVPAPTLVNPITQTWTVQPFDPAAPRPPFSNAGVNQYINTTISTLYGSGSWQQEGTIAKYAWSKISGPNATIVSPTSMNTAVNGLSNGTYIFQLTVTNNLRASASSTVKVVVNNNPVSNQAPISIAGDSMSITLPVNTVTLRGRGTDSDGTIASYSWSKISGPAATIATPASATTAINNMVAGTYKFELKVTDNLGATGTSTITVVVLPRVNQAPTSNAGGNQTITLPTNTVTLIGNGTDVDGSIVSYSWTKDAGGAGTISSPSSASTTITAMVAGTYKFELKVTDNDGGTGTSTVQVIVLPRPNQAPSANAGNNQTITLPTNTVTLSGSGTDVDGTITSYNWIKTSGGIASISNATTASTNVTNLAEGNYTFQLTVTDNSGATATSSVQVIVLRLPNQAPTANAGSNQTITLPANSVSLRGSGSDADGTIVSYSWVKTSGPAATIGNISSALTSVNNLVEGTYSFTLTVTDNDGATATSSVQVNVLPRVNQAPTASAGTNQTITLPTNAVTLSGSGVDNDGTIVSYSWTKISGTGGTIANQSSASTIVSNLVEGTYVFELKVTDNNGATATSSVQVVVLPRPNQAPTANAGGNQTITLPTNSVSLNGTGIDNDGTIISYSWIKISGPSANIINASSASTIVTNMVEGTYRFEFQVTDNAGAIATSTVSVTVLPRPNEAPIAYAGSNQTITLPVNSVTLIGTGSDADGTIVSYNWVKTSGSSASITNQSSASTTVTALVEGTYIFTLTVKDNSGASATSTVQVIVLPRVNQAPTANAGNDQIITLPTNSVSLRGVGTDTDGSIVSYRWTKVSGPAATITSSSTASTTVTNMVEGTYSFRLTVTDNSGATATSNVQVIVLPRINNAPTSNAGNNQTITLPVNSVTLSGNGTDEDGTVVFYSWNLTSGPSASISNPSSASTAVTNMVEGVYTFTLSVTDNDGAVATSTVQVTVLPRVNQAPTANAGNNQTITLPTNSVTLNGSGADTDGSIISYNWSKISGSAATITSPSSASTTVTNMVEGTYSFQLTVTDNSGATATSNVQVIVLPRPNQAPTANAGDNQTITLPTNSATLNGSGIDEDGTIVSYSWNLTSGPAATITSSTSASTTVINMVEGTYTFTLTVTDNSGATATSSVEVIVLPRINGAPTANAGNNQTITLPTNTVTLNGVGIDADGTIVSYSWRKVSGPTANISNPSSATTAVINMVEGTYIYRLTVTDNSGASATSTVQVTVLPRVNQAPTVDAGNNQTITLPINSVTLSGSGNDTDGSIVSYSWIKTSGPAATISSSSSASTTVTGMVEGIYTFTLTATDNNGATGTASVQIKVLPRVNQAPTANAGNNQTITLPINTVTLSGSGTDADGTIVSYSWTKISGPAATITSATNVSTTVTNMVEGAYSFELKVTDNSGATASSNVQVTVLPRVNQAPTSIAGDDKTITLPLNTVTLNGSGTDSDGTIVGYTWRKVSGPAATITSPATASTTITEMVEGTYRFELKVKDNSGATAISNVQVTVLPRVNQAPSANAGNNLTITLPVNNVTLRGTGTDSDGTIAFYNWTKVSGPDATISSPTSANTAVRNMVEGIYTFNLRVTDNEGATGSSLVQVTVLSNRNQAPVSYGGGNKIVLLPKDTVTISGSGSDVDGTIISYKWLKINGPAGGVITSPNQQTTLITNLLDGVYYYQFIVEDNGGLTSRDTIAIYVYPEMENRPPVANAGLDVTVYLPQDMAVLIGSGTDDGEITSYRWRLISGPTVPQISEPNMPRCKVNDLKQGTYYMELTVFDNGGKSGSDTVAIYVGNSRLSIEAPQNESIYPNPVSNSLNVKIVSDVIERNVKLILYNSRGNQVAQKRVNLVPNSNVATFNVAGLTPGMYTLKVVYANKPAVSLKVIKI